MEGLLDINVFMNHLEEKGLMVAPRNVVEARVEAIALDRLRRSALKKKALTFKQIADAQLWGSISTKAAKSYALKHSKPGEIFETKKGQMVVYRILTAAVVRLSKSRGQSWD